MTSTYPMIRFILISILFLFLYVPAAEASTNPVISIFARDNCGQSRTYYATEDNNADGIHYSGYTGDDEPSCIGGYVSMGVTSLQKDVRFCINNSEINDFECTPWASAGGGASGFTHGSGDIEDLIVGTEFRPMPPYTPTILGLSIRYDSAVNNSCTDIRYGTNSSFSTDGTAQYSVAADAGSKDINCVRVGMNVQFQAPPPAKPDIVLSAVTPSAVTVTEDGTITFDTTVSNIGNYGTGGEFDIVFEFATSSTDTKLVRSESLGAVGTGNDMYHGLVDLYETVENPVACAWFGECVLIAAAVVLAGSPSPPCFPTTCWFKVTQDGIVPTTNPTNRPISTSYRFNAPSAGTWNVRACADGGNEIDESDETNNCTGWIQITVNSANQPPAKPTISGPATGFINTEYTFSSSSTDPNGDNVRYEIDWDSSTFASRDQCLPASCSDFVSSGAVQTASRQWPGAGPHSFVVRAIDSNGVASVDSDPFTINISVPPAPSMNTITADSYETSATLHGSGNPNAVSTTGWFRYSTTNPVACDDVFGTRVPAAAGDLLGSGNAAVGYDESIVGLTSGNTEYFYCAIGVNSNGSKGFGAVNSFRTLYPVPSGLSATAGACNSGNISVSWSPIVGATYDLLIDGITTQSNVLSPYSHVVSNDGALHTYSIRSKNSNAQPSAWSPSVGVNAPLVCTYPDLVPSNSTAEFEITTAGSMLIQGLVQNSGANNAVNAFYADLEIDWYRDDSDIRNYNANPPLYTDRVGGLLGIGSTVNLSREVNSLIGFVPGSHRYRFWTDTMNEVNEDVAGESNNHSAWIDFIVRLLSPSNLTATPVAACSSRAVNLSWDAVAGAVSYGVKVNTDPLVDVGNVLSHTVGGLLDSTPYNFTVAARDSSGNWSANSPDKSAVTADICKPNLNEPAITVVPSAGFNAVTGIYDSITIELLIENDGNADVLGTEGSEYEIEFKVSDGTGNIFDNTVVGQIGAIAAGSSVGPAAPYQKTFNNVPFGRLYLKVCVDIDDDIDESNETDNCRIMSGPTVFVTPPIPSLSIDVDGQEEKQIKNGDTVDVAWDTDLTYPMDCRVDGPGISVAPFDPSIPLPNPPGSPSGSETTDPLTAKSVYTIKCTELITGTVFTDTATVEVIGTVEEI